jgi:carbamoyltransferase
VKVLGLIGLGKNPGACLMEDGRLTACVEEERFVREKVAMNRWPIQSIRYCLKAGATDLGEVDRIAVAWNCNKYPEAMGDFFRSLGASYPRKGDSFRADETQILSRYTPENYLRALNRELQAARMEAIHKLTFYDHHRCHAASAFFSSGFEDALVLVMDGSGEEEATTVWRAGPRGLEKIKTYLLPHSLGRVYATLTEYLGFRAYTDEGKVMGLAPYGRMNPTVHQRLSRVLAVDDDGDYRVDPNFIYYGAHTHSPRFTDDLVELLGPPRHPMTRDEPIAEIYKDIAFSLQSLLETAASGLVRRYLAETGLRKVCISGGVAMNCKMNGVIAGLEGVEDLFVHPASHDGGVCIGAAMLAARDAEPGTSFEPLAHAYYGPDYGRDEIELLLRYAKLDFRRVDDVAPLVADALVDGKIVALFQGRMEMGPRALGNRSILANPLLPETKKLLNGQVKHREDWRPFCPSILVEYGDEFFEGIKHPYYMAVAAKVRPEKASLIPSAVHVDGSARPQFVSRKVNVTLWRIIEAFRQRTGVPVVINTSFNVMAEPIINSPHEALRCFYSTGIDILVLEDYLLSKNFN